MNRGTAPRLLAAALALAAAGACAQSVSVRVAGVPLGSGVPAAIGMPTAPLADHVADGLFHAPNYLPGHPTAATLWPRLVHLPCRRHDASGELRCAGYDVSPIRGEYIYFYPVIERELPPPQQPQQPPPPDPPPEPPPRPAHAVPKKPLG